MKLLLKDKKLLYWLDQNSRATNKDLARRIRISEQGVGYKLKRLEEEGIILRYVTFVNTLALGYSHYKVLLRLQNTNPQKEQEIIDSLVANPNIRWVVSCSGKWDINFSTMARTHREFVQIYRAIESAFGDYIAEKNIALLIKSPGFTRGYLINQKSLKTLEYEARPVPRELDQMDKGILKLLSQHARKNVVTIARELKTTVDVVRYRLKKLEKEKVIGGYTIQLGLDKMDVLRYSAYFSLHKMTEAIEQKMYEFAKMHNHIIFILVMIGAYDVSLELEVPSHQVLENTIKTFREAFAENIKDFEIILNTHQYKYDFFPFTT